jgi:hypothetical protein
MGSRSTKATGQDFVEWFNGSKEDLDEKCPTCGEHLVLRQLQLVKKMEM